MNADTLNQTVQESNSEPLGDFGGWDTFGDYFAWFERAVMGFDEVVTEPCGASL